MRLRVAALGLFVLLRSTSGQTQTSTFASGIEAVRVDVLVTEDGKPVRGLQAADFDVLDNGVRQQVDLVSFEQIPLNVVLALDMSDSVIGERLENLRSAAGAVLDGLKRDDQAGLITFSHVVAQASGLTSELTQVRAALGRTLPPGETALVDGSFAGMMLGESDVGRALVIVFSDGLDTSSWLSPDQVLETAKHSDVVVYAVVLGASSRPAFLRDLSAATGGRLFQADSTNNLKTTFLGILDEFRQRYLVSYSPRGVAKDGWHQLDVRAHRRGASVKARPGYFSRS
jgi:Ca-activated chloride channel homolog